MPSAPSSRVRSSTVISRADGGSSRRKCSAGHGRYSRTFTTPTRPPAALSTLHVSSVVSLAEPMMTITFSGSGWPTYSTSLWRRPVSAPTSSIVACTIAGALS